MVRGPGRTLPELPRPDRLDNRDASRETLSGALLALGVIGVPFLLTVIPLLVLNYSGFAGTEVLRAVFWTAAFTSHVVLLPLAVGLVSRNRQRKLDIVREMEAFFSAKIIGLYRLQREVPAVVDDPRAAEAFEIYSRAERQIEAEVNDPLRSRPEIERGVALVDELLEDYRAPRFRRPGRLHPGREQLRPRQAHGEDHYDADERRVDEHL